MMAVRGFTLIEILVVLLILGIMIGALFMVLNSGDIAFSVDMGMLDIQQQARQGMDAVARELRQAEDVTVSVEDDSSDRITFNTASATGVIFYRDNNNRLLREYPAGTIKVLANNITRFKCALSGTLLEIQLRTDKTVRQKAVSFSLAERIRLRNE